METIKGILTRMNTTAGRAKNRFDLDRINVHLRFKNQEDAIVSNTIIIVIIIEKRGLR